MGHSFTAMSYHLFRRQSYLPTGACVAFAENLGKTRDGRQFFQGDIILTPEQEAVINGSLRGSIMNKRWPNGVIPYVIDRSLCK